MAASNESARQIALRLTHLACGAVDATRFPDAEVIALAPYTGFGET
jgi:hypothetical protein